MTAALWILYVAVGLVGLLFLAGMLSAAWENHKERRDTGRVTRPGWQVRRERPCYCCEGYVCTYCDGPRVAVPLQVRRRL